MPTVYSFYGLQTADLLWRDAVYRPTANNQVQDKIIGAGCVMWDEASMSSSQILELHITFIMIWQRKVTWQNRLEESRS